MRIKSFLPGYERLTMTQPTAEQISAFLLDEGLQELSERLKTSDGVLDLISLVENQHSSVIAWMCDSREGHGQGESILRDLLCHASAAAQNRITASGVLKLKGCTAKFFKTWTPAKLRTTGLSAAFVAKEFSEKIDERLDILVIDPSNKLLIAIENKVLAKVDGPQLERYREFLEELRSRKPLKGFELAHIVVDKKFDDVDETDYADTVGLEYHNWLTLSYEWLRDAAIRSTVQMTKGQLGGRLIQAYCRQQTDWESEDDKACSILAATLTLQHREVVSALCDMTNRPDKTWVLSGPASKKTAPELQLFAVQNRDVLRALLGAKGFVAVKRTLLKEHPELSEDLVQHARVWMDVIPRCFASFTYNDYWPLYLSARLNQDNTCNVKLIFSAKHLAPNYKSAELRKWASSIAPGIEKHSESSIRRRTLSVDVKLEELHEILIEWENKIEILSKKVPLPSGDVGQ